MDYNVQKNSQNNDMASLVNDVCNIIETGRKEAYVAAGKSAIITYWNIGRRIVKEEQQGKERAEYGAEVIKNLALKIIPRYGSSYNKRNLDYYKRFYLLFPDIQIVNTCVHNLSWSHIRRILSVSDPNNNTALQLIRILRLIVPTEKLQKILADEIKAFSEGKKID